MTESKPISAKPTTDDELSRLEKSAHRNKWPFAGLMSRIRADGEPLMAKDRRITELGAALLIASRLLTSRNAWAAENLDDIGRINAALSPRRAHVSVTACDTSDDAIFAALAPRKEAAK